jgi:hypothetical protein
MRRLYRRDVLRPFSGTIGLWSLLCYSVATVVIGFQTSYWRASIQLI